MAGDGAILMIPDRREPSSAAASDEEPSTLHADYAPLSVIRH